VLGALGAFVRIVTDRGEQAFPPVPVTTTSFEHRFRLPAGATWVRAEVYGEDEPAVRDGACNLVGGADGVAPTTYCTGSIPMLALT
jgi:hypothetical protein